jgi:KaiC/GvpD/RAD55 family RecA-like ATPase
MKPYYKRLLISGIFSVAVAPLIFSFQNCSKTNFSAVESSFVEGTSLRKLSLDPSSDQKVTESGLLKVMLVVDNSATMKNSQENLKRNISYLLSTLKNRNAEVTIITSDYTSQALSDVNDTVDPVTKKNFSRGNKKVLNAAVTARRPVYKFSKTDDAALFAKNIGLDQEAQLLSFAANLNYDSFFKKGDAALVYFITDEDDEYTFNPTSGQIHTFMHRLYNTQQANYTYNQISCKNCFSYQYSWFREDGQTEAGTTTAYFPSMSACTKSYTGMTSSGYRLKSACASTQSGISFSSTGLTCENYFKSPGAFTESEVTCTERSYSSESGSDYMYYSLYNSEYSRSKQQVNNQGLPLASGDTVKMNLYQYDLFSGLKKHMDELFDKKYFIGVSTNIKGQNCNLSAGQSYDKVFTLFSSVIPKEQMLISSICDSVNFQTNLEAVSKSFEKIIKSDYVIDINTDLESVVAIDLILMDGSVMSLSSDQFVQSGRSLSFRNIDLNKYNIKQIEVTLNVNKLGVKKEAK